MAIKILGPTASPVSGYTVWRHRDDLGTVAHRHSPRCYYLGWNAEVDRHGCDQLDWADGFNSPISPARHYIGQSYYRRGTEPYSSNYYDRSCNHRCHDPASIRTVRAVQFRLSTYVC